MTNNLRVTTAPTAIRAYRCAGRLFILLGLWWASAALLVTGGSATEMQRPIPPSDQGSPPLLSGSPIDSGKLVVSAKFEGSLDKVEVESLGGWAWDASQPNVAIKVDVYDGTRLLATVTAEELREDLKSAGKGDGKHAFNYAFPQTLRDGQTHIISVKFAGTAIELPGSPKTLLFPKL